MNHTLLGARSKLVGLCAGNELAAADGSRSVVICRAAEPRCEPSLGSPPLAGDSHSISELDHSLRSWALGEWVARLRRFASPARWLYLIKSALALLVAASVAHQLVTRSWYLVTIPNTRGAIPQVDRWTTILRPNDFVLLQPHILIAQYGAYLKARFNIEAYVQPNERKAWTETRRLLLDRRLPFGRAIYLTEEVIETTTSTPLRLLGEIPLNYRQGGRRGCTSFPTALIR